MMKHRVGVQHGNIDGLRQKGCGYCRQYELIKRRDGGPTHLQVEQDSPIAATKVATLPHDNHSTSSFAVDPTESNQHIQTPIARIGDRDLAAPTDFAAKQSSGDNPVATIYQAIQSQTELTKEKLKLRCSSLKRRNGQWHSI